MIQGRLSDRREFTPVPSLSSVFVYMMITEKSHAGATHTGVKISFRREISQRCHVNEESPLAPM